ncbi:MAG: glycosyltransferase [Lachnospiraceae bacterium]|nr:glycosyltransferase [Lachnospiraceae bacterium]
MNKILDKFAISVVVPIFNVENYLRECLDSLEHQTLKSMQVILVDDGSTDASGVIAEEFVKKDSRFVLINRKNGGLSAARNTGIDVAKGEYLYFLDSDDYLHDNALETLYNHAKTYNLDAIRFSAFTFEDGTKEYRWEHKNGYKFAGKYPDVMNGLEFYKESVEQDDYYPSCCLVLMRRQLIVEHALRFVEGILHEDNLFNFQLMTFCQRVGVINEALYYRRYRSNSITQKQDWQNKVHSLCISAELTDSFIEAHLDNKRDLGRHQIEYCLNMILFYWNQLPRKEQDSKIIRGYLFRATKMAMKYKVRIKSFFLLSISHKFFRMIK